jgi:hypothetical protein
MEFDAALNLAQTAVLVATVGVMIWQARESRRVSQIDRYHALNEHYIEFVKLCLEHPELEIDDLDEFAATHKLDAKGRAQMVTGELLLCIWEHAFDSWKTGFLSGDQWRAWDGWIHLYIGLKLTRDQWTYMADDYGPEFSVYVKEVAAEMGIASPLESTAAT